MLGGANVRECSRPWPKTNCVLLLWTSGDNLWHN
uniref:Uncharacterized protein n=1 Tax=Anguilla anguilla TaxID=7936 RepID=A0A0E9UW54_ANGAN